MTAFAQRHAISDVCILTADIERSIAFYTDRLGFTLKHRAPGFADFNGAGLTLALWDIGHISHHAGLSAERGSGHHNVLIAVLMSSPVELDACHAELAAKGVAFERPPADYAWNARCCYFAGPDGEVWELYAWLDGGAPGKLA
ncbi:VOC family protein [Labrys neptuniae]